MNMIIRPLFFILFFICVFLSHDMAFAYRPYVTSSASVAREGGWDTQNGFVKYSRDNGVDTVDAPLLNWAYGFTKDWEIGFLGTMQVYKNRDYRDCELSNSGVYFDYMIRDGVLQGKEGLSVMAEASISLPTTIERQEGVGCNILGAIAGKFFDFGYHANIGFDATRDGFKPGVVWTGILEYPVGEKLKFGVELAGRAHYNMEPNNTVGVAAILTLGRCSFDAGMRMGISDAADDLMVTSGVSIGF